MTLKELGMYLLKISIIGAVSITAVVAGVFMLGAILLEMARGALPTPMAIIEIALIIAILEMILKVAFRARREVL